MSLHRVRVFVDYWNFQLGLNLSEAERKGEDPDTYRFKIDWTKVGKWLSDQAFDAASVAITDRSFDGLSVYTSHDARTEEGRKYHRWATGWLSRQTGVTVHCRERKPKAFQRCGACHAAINICPHCKVAINATQEKGVDTLIATDMIRLAWEGAYEIAVLATSDRDLIPAVEFLGLKSLKVIHAALPPRGSDLSRTCWASFDVGAKASQIERP